MNKEGREIILMKKSPRFGNAGLLLVFSLSGAAVLIYEVLWARQLELIFGSTVYAVSAILSVFFMGLAFGGFLFGSLIDKNLKCVSAEEKTRRLIRYYALVEIVIGLYALTTPRIFSFIGEVQLSFLDASSASFLWLAAARFVLLAAALIVPTTLMGGTLPLVTSLFTKSSLHFGKRFGGLYSVNTLGGVFGILVAGFYLMAEFGAYPTLLVAAGLNFLIGAAMLIYSHRANFSESTLHGMPAEQPDAASAIKIHRRLVLFAFFLAGFGAIALEVLWTRVLILVIGSSTYAFSTILAVFLTGLVLGSAIAAKFVDRSKNLMRDLVFIEIGIALSVFASTLIFYRLPFWFLEIFALAGGEFDKLLILQFLLVAAPMIIPTTLMGMAFPVAAGIYLRNLSWVGRSAGSVYAVNTIGGIFGPLAASFLIIPAVGLQYGILFISGLFFLIGILLFLGHKKLFNLGRMRLAVLCISAVLVVLAVFFEPWHPRIMGSGVYFYADNYLKMGDIGSVREAILSDKVLFHKEGTTASVLVTEMRTDDGSRKVSLIINGKPDASSGVDLDTEVILGTLPLVVHQNPKDVLVIGLGSGITAGAVLQSDISSVDVVEIEPVVAKAGEFYKENNHDALNDPRLTLFFDDARHFIRTTGRTYDVITAESSNPWISGVSTLFTKEQFELYRKHLNPHGIVFQWLHTYSMSDRDLRTVAATFQSVFPDVALWQGSNGADIFLMGSTEPMQIDFERLQARLNEPKLQQELERIFLDDPYTLLSYFILDSEGIGQFSEGSKLHTDGHPVLEYSAPKSLNKNTYSDNLRILMSIRESPLPLLTNFSEEDEEILSDYEYGMKKRLLEGIAASEHASIDKLIELFEKAIQANPNDEASKFDLAQLLYLRGRTFLEMGIMDEAQKAFESAIALNSDHAGTHKELGRIYISRQFYSQALLSLETAERINPEDGETKALIGLAESLLSGSE